MIILGIETSCDDTGIAVIDINDTTITILSNIVHTQTIHNTYGGVFPAKAKEEHKKNINIVYEEAYKKAGRPKIDAIALTVGPGLEPSLWVGITFAEELSKKLGVKIIPVNHMEGHLLSSLLPEYDLNKKINFREMPKRAISLLVSGGHTQLIQVVSSRQEAIRENQNPYKILGTTLDDAVGEAFDKVARMLDLPYPGGPAISKLSEEAREKKLKSKDFVFPRPMLHSSNYDFSFSGLKTAIMYHLRDNPVKNDEEKMIVAREFEDAAIEVIVKKTVRAVLETGSTHVMLGGGVAANKHLQNELDRVAKENDFTVYHPVRQITGDNALMIAIAGYFHQDLDHPLKANGKLKL